MARTPRFGFGPPGIVTARGSFSPPMSRVRKVACRPPSAERTATASWNCSSSLGSSGRSRYKSSVRNKPTDSAPSSSAPGTSDGASMFAESSIRTPSRVAAGPVPRDFSACTCDRSRRRRSSYTAIASSSGPMTTSPRDPSTTSLSPDRTAAHKPRTPTTKGISSALRMMAACDVLPPRSAAKPTRPDRGRCKASIGERMDPIPIAAGARGMLCNISGRPRSVRRRRSPMASTSAPRSRRYGSSMRSNVAAIPSITRRTAHSATTRSFSIRRRAPSTTSSSLSIIR